MATVRTPNTPQEVNRYNEGVGPDNREHFLTNLELAPAIDTTVDYRPWVALSPQPEFLANGGVIHHAALQPIQPRAIQEGDWVRRKPDHRGNPRTYLDGTPFQVSSLHDFGSTLLPQWCALDPDSNHHVVENLELCNPDGSAIVGTTNPTTTEGNPVTDTTITTPRDFHPGDVVTTYDNTVQMTVDHTDIGGTRDAARVWFTTAARNGQLWAYADDTHLVTAADAPKPLPRRAPGQFLPGDIVENHHGEGRIVDRTETLSSGQVRVWFTSGTHLAAERVTMVTPIASVAVDSVTPEPDPAKIEPGDIVTLSGRDYRVVGLRQTANSSTNPAWDLVDAAHGVQTNWDYERYLTVKTKAADAGPMPRKLGTVPDSQPNGVTPISMTDPGVAWFWADAAAAADVADFCPEYERLAKILGVPGRIRKFSGNITVRGMRVDFTDIEADSLSDAQRLFRENLIAELQSGL